MTHCFKNSKANFRYFNQVSDVLFLYKDRLLWFIVFRQGGCKVAACKNKRNVQFCDAYHVEKVLLFFSVSKSKECYKETYRALSMYSNLSYLIVSYQLQLRRHQPKTTSLVSRFRVTHPVKYISYFLRAHLIIHFDLQSAHQIVDSPVFKKMKNENTYLFSAVPFLPWYLRWNV